ncbi:SNF2 family N-terminal domain-containing protein [Lineolata rhizophorae]|uniref:SNF2 family N-terminal domain-containing protein n=1 Tax=Lineolata rhizophorae TaxID=578093 RepID=A0A6A6NP53_9PEZI|nr:SNF2 family N-terminal domain-containing protein [Lineolata rhizophorae]
MHTHLESRPAKKRRFFVDDPPPRREPSPPSPQPAHQDAPQDADMVDAQEEGKREPDQNSSRIGDTAGSARGFNADEFEGILGRRLPAEELNGLHAASGGDVCKAINIYFDDSRPNPSFDVLPHSPAQVSLPSSTPSPPALSQVAAPSTNFVSDTNDTTSTPPHTAKPPPQQRQEYAPALAAMPAKRYVGAFGVAGWTTRSGHGLLSAGEHVGIERSRSEAAAARQDVVVRFTNARGAEVGRLENESAVWISALLDQGVCSFEGTCVYVPEGRVRTGETVFLQLRAYLLRDAFRNEPFVREKAGAEKKVWGEGKETPQDRLLRWKQIGLVKLFDELGLAPSTAASTGLGGDKNEDEKSKRKGLLQAVESAEQSEQQSSSTQKKSGAKEESAGGGGSSPSSPEEQEDGKELEQDQLDTLYKKAQSFDFFTPEAQPAGSFAMHLRKYQKQALHWLISKEKERKAEHKEMSMHPLWEEYTWPTKDVDDKDLPAVEGVDKFYINPYSGEMSLEFPVQDQNCLGGILADEMGLGKTIEMLGLIHSHKSDIAQAAADASANNATALLPRLPKSMADIEPAPATTLVVAPMSLLAQWQSEAEKASRPGTLKVLVYYGNDRSFDLRKQCCAANVANAPNLIITSYGTVLSEYHQVADLTSRSTGLGGGDRSSHGGLFSVDYFRVILDEAHHIKNRQSKTAKACYEIAATHRWVLTGTPIVNRLEDLFSLVRFLRVQPWSNFSFWKTFITLPFEARDFIRALNVVQTVLEPLVLRRTKSMRTPDGEPLVPLPPRHIHIEHVDLGPEERDVYNYVFLRAQRTFEDTIDSGPGGVQAVMKSYTSILAQIMRLRQSCCHPVLVRHAGIVADEEEAKAAKEAADGLADDVDLAGLVDRFSAAVENAEKSVGGDDGISPSQEDENVVSASRFGATVLREIQEGRDKECPLCCEPPSAGRGQAVVAGCWHSACLECVRDHLEHEKGRGDGTARCWDCRATIGKGDVFEVVRDEDHADVIEDGEGGNASDPDSDSESAPSEGEDGPANDDGPVHSSPAAIRPKPVRTPSQRITLRRINPIHTTSAKTSALLSHLRRLRRRHPRAKAVVFSQFTSFLDVLEAALTRAGLRHLRFDGSMSQRERAAVLRTFAGEDEAAQGAVLLISLKAGGVGLNLTAARHVFVMDPWWSWAVEAQAIDRVHRMGQVGRVRVTRFVVRGSIEEKMLRIQERKKFIASSLGMMSDEEKKLQRIEDIKELLS